MTYTLAPFRTIPLDEELLEHLIDEHEKVRLPRLNRLWCYYRNALAEPTEAGGSAAPPAQMAGLPERLIEIHDLRRDDRFSREIVIENDIAWRIHTLVDFMFPESPRIVSRAEDPEKRSEIETLLESIFEFNGGSMLWQNAALLGSVYGYVDFLLNTDRLAGVMPGKAPSKPSLPSLIDQVASRLLIETVEAPRAFPLVNRNDFRSLDAYILHFQQPLHEVEREGILAKFSRALRKPTSCATWALRSKRAGIKVTEIHSVTHHQRYEDEQLVSETVNRLGRVPVVHIQNLSLPLFYEGLSDVEPLIPLQDELNTRLSDRANRVTMQSFRMWLGKGIDGFTDRPVGPGQMWVTDNTDASIEAFGGDADSPSERQHIEELREALDKASGVTPAAAGHIKARVGNLTSENALRISLMGTIAKIKRKRITYGTGIEALADLILHALDVYGVYRTSPRDRNVNVTWTDPLPVDESRRLDDALIKAELGVPRHILREELGYPETLKGDTDV